MSGSQKGRPAVLLRADHVDQVRAVLAAHPGVSLRSVAPVVARACGLASMNVATLSRFVTRHGLPREQPVCIARRSQRCYGRLGPEHRDLVLGLYHGGVRGAWGVLDDLEQRLGFRVSREELWRFLEANGAPHRAPGRAAAGGAR